MKADKVDAYVKFVEWLETPRAYRVPPTQNEICAQLGISRPTAINWKKKIGVPVKREDKEREEWEYYTKKAAYERGNPKALEMLGRAKKFIGDKGEETGKFTDLTADDYYDILRTARDRVATNQAELNGTGSMSSESIVLPEQVCVDTGQEQCTTDKVAALAVPERSSPSLSNR